MKNCVVREKHTPENECCVLPNIRHLGKFLDHYLHCAHENT